MASTATQQLAIPGLHATPSKSDLEQSSILYNKLKEDSAQPEVNEFHLSNLAAIFMRYNVFSKFGLHLIHGHFPLAQDKVMLGTYVPELTGYWTKPTEIDAVNLADVHGHIYVMAGKNSFIAYEYRDGPPVDLSDVKPDFFHDVVEYLQANGLQDVLGLQVLTADCSEKMAEFDLGAGAGTIMLRDSDAKYGRVYRVTGWVFEVRDGIVSCKGNDVHAATTKGPHKVFQDSKLLRNVHELAEALKAEEIVS